MGYRFEVLRMRALFYAQEETMKAYDFKEADFAPSAAFTGGKQDAFDIPCGTALIDLKHVTEGIDFNVLMMRLPDISNKQSNGRTNRS